MINYRRDLSGIVLTSTRQVCRKWAIGPRLYNDILDCVSSYFCTSILVTPSVDRGLFRIGQVAHSSRPISLPSLRKAGRSAVSVVVIYRQFVTMESSIETSKDSSTIL